MSKISLSPSPTGSAVYTIASPAGSTDRTLTIPDSTTTLVGTDATQTLTNKSIVATQLTGDVAAARITTALNATGSAPIYAARAWVNFNGTGTVAIRASGNVSSITDGGVGTYTVNFTTAMPDANYCFQGSSGGTGTNGILVTFGSDADPVSVLTGSIALQTKSSSSHAKLDASHISVAIFR